MQTVHHQLQALKANGHGAHEADYFVRIIRQAQRILTTLLGVQEEICHAQGEGIIEVTVRSRTKHFTVALTPEVSEQIAENLYNMVGKQCDTQAKEIIYWNGTLVKEGEWTDRSKILELLLTPVDAQGMPVQDLPSQDQAA